jgi:hypothetical protein
VGQLHLDAARATLREIDRDVVEAELVAGGGGVRRGGRLCAAQHRVVRRAARSANGPVT